MTPPTSSAIDGYIGRAARWLQRALEPWTYRGAGRYCPICDSNSVRFQPMPEFYLRNWMEHGYVRSPFAAEMLNIVEFTCPRCGATDRSRLYAHFFTEVFAKLPTGQKHRFIDFAPSGSLSGFLRRFNQLEYRTADLFAEGVDDQVDICDLKPYADCSADFFLCSHVLEHVPDDRRALRELCRILKPTGLGVLVVPINLGNTQIEEDPTLTDIHERWRQFGQDDHIRSYSKPGWLERLAEAGFAIEELGIDHFGRETFHRLGLVDRSVIYIVRKTPRA